MAGFSVISERNNGHHVFRLIGDRGRNARRSRNPLVVRLHVQRGRAGEGPPCPPARRGIRSAPVRDPSPNRGHSALVQSGEAGPTRSGLKANPASRVTGPRRLIGESQLSNFGLERVRLPIRRADRINRGLHVVRELLFVVEDDRDGIFMRVDSPSVLTARKRVPKCSTPRGCGTRCGKQSFHSPLGVHTELRSAHEFDVHFVRLLRLGAPPAAQCRGSA